MNIAKFPKVSTAEDQYKTPESQSSFKPKSSNYASMRHSPRSPTSIVSETAPAQSTPSAIPRVVESQKGGYPSPSAGEHVFGKGSHLPTVEVGGDHEVADAFRAQVLAACAASTSMSPQSIGVPKLYEIPQVSEPVEHGIDPELAKYLSPKAVSVTPRVFISDPLDSATEAVYGDVSDSFRQQVLTACEHAFLNMPTSPPIIKESPRQVRGIEIPFLVVQEPVMSARHNLPIVLEVAAEKEGPVEEEAVAAPQDEDDDLTVSGDEETRHIVEDQEAAVKPDLAPGDEEILISAEEVISSPTGQVVVVSDYDVPPTAMKQEGSSEEPEAISETALPAVEIVIPTLLEELSPEEAVQQLSVPVEDSTVNPEGVEEVSPKILSPEAGPSTVDDAVKDSASAVAAASLVVEAMDVEAAVVEAVRSEAAVASLPSLMPVSDEGPKGEEPAGLRYPDETPSRKKKGSRRGCSCF